MKYFGTDGIRGIYEDELTDELAYKAGLAASRFFPGDCIVGRDTRTSGEALVEALTSGLVAGGINVRTVGIIPTPAVSYLAHKYNAGGIMVSASHNPPSYNGLKFFSPTGYKLTQYLESGVEECIDHPPARIGGGTVRRFEGGTEEYLSFLTEGADLSGKKITLDCCYGAAVSVAGEAFERLGADVTLLSDEEDGAKINCGVGALYPEYVASRSDGLCFAFDGDADRLAVCLDGRVIDGDSVLFNLAMLLSPHGVAGTVLANMALERELAENGIMFLRTAVGDKHICEAMRRYGYALGGEQSGHYIIAPSRSGDALKAAITLSRLNNFRLLKLVPQKAVSVPASKEALYDEKFIAVKAECQRKLSCNGRMVVRMSGTEPKIRIMVESEDEKLIEEIIDILSETIVNKERI